MVERGQPLLRIHAREDARLQAALHHLGTAIAIE